ncbi:MAG: hypothetical protein MI724_12145 [Spirochaetales bacterium]|nr:hypothetical protein [Spirochaetales bacterium]
MVMQRSVAGIVGGLAAGEALLLLIGMNLPQPSDWSTPSNIALAIGDVAVGGALAALVATRSDAPNTPLFYVLTSLLIVTHTYRSVEYFLDIAQPFAANVPLFAVNNVKLTGAVGAISLSIALPR